MSNPHRFDRRALTALTVSALAATGFIGSSLMQSATAVGTPFISEYHYDNTGTDVDEFVEVNANGADITGWKVYLFNGGTASAAVVYGAVGGYPLTANAQGVAVVSWAPGTTNNIQNGAADGIALVNAAGQVVELISYEGVFTVAATSPIAAGMTSTDIGVAQAGTEPLGSSLQKRSTGWVATLGANTKGAPNETVTPPTGDLAFSEIHYNNTGVDIDERIELAVPAGVSTTGWKIELYNGDTATAATKYATLSVGAASGGFVVVDAPGIQNGDPDGMALVRPDGTVAQFISYGGVITAADGAAVGTTSVNLPVAQSDTTPAGYTLQLVNGSWIGPSQATWGATNVNVAPPTGCAVGATHTIAQVQGSGAATPLAGQTVTVRGVVTADHQAASAKGFYLQDVAGDGNPATSDGIFIYDPATVKNVAIGDVVQLTGKAAEYFDMTQIANLTQVDLCSTGNPAPAPADLDLPATPETLESLEGMFVKPVDTLHVSEVYNLNRFGEIMLSEGGVLQTPTEIATPGAAVQAVAASNAKRSIILDDASTVNLATAGLNPPYLTPTNPIRVGDTVAAGAIEPVVLNYAYSAFRLQPVDGTADGTAFTATNPRTNAPEAVGGTVKAGSFNVLNYFVTFPSVDSRARGAVDATSLAKQQDKIVNAIDAMGADVLALQEIENSCVMTPATPYKALETLVGALNAKAGGDKWGYVPACETSDVITNAIIYRKDTGLSVVGAPAKPAESPAWSNAREPIAQQFSKNGDGFVVVGNHFKSKSPGSPTGNNVDTGDGQGAWNGARVAQAQELASFLNGIATSTGESDILILGDLNAYTAEDPITTLKAAGFVDVAGPTLDKASYVYMGNAGRLDHTLASSSLAGKVTGHDVWQINAHEAYGYQYNGTPNLYVNNAFRASDHNPQLVGLNLAAPIDTDTLDPCQGLTPTLVGTDGDDILVGGPGRDVIVGKGGSDLILGTDGDDVLCGGNDGDWIFAGGGDDTVQAGGGFDIVWGHEGADTLYGGADTDVISGGSENDKLFGGSGNDTLVGDLGDDMMNGESGADRISTRGNDTVVPDPADTVQPWS